MLLLLYKGVVYLVVIEHRFKTSHTIKGLYFWGGCLGHHQQSSMTAGVVQLGGLNFPISREVWNRTWIA